MKYLVKATFDNQSSFEEFVDLVSDLDIENPTVTVKGVPLKEVKAMFKRLGFNIRDSGREQ